MANASKTKPKITFVPGIHPVFFYLTVFLGFLALSVFTTDYFRYLPISRTSTITTISYFLDPIICHFLGGILLLCSFSIFFIKISTSDISSPLILIKDKLFIKSIIVFTILMLLIMLFEYKILELVLLKPSFDHPRPDINNFIGPSFFEKFFKSKQEYLPNWDSNGSPSGFALRQVIITLCSFSLLFNTSTNINIQPSDSEPLRSKLIKNTSLTIAILLIILLCYVCFQRIYRGFHSFYDIGISIGFGIFFFWLCYTFLYAIVFKKVMMLNEFVVISFGYVTFFFFLSGSAHLWALAGFLCLPLYAIFYGLSARRASSRNYHNKIEKEIKKRTKEHFSTD